MIQRATEGMSIVSQRPKEKMSTKPTAPKRKNRMRAVLEGFLSRDIFKGHVSGFGSFGYADDGLFPFGVGDVAGGVEAGNVRLAHSVDEDLALVVFLGSKVVHHVRERNATAFNKDSVDGQIFSLFQLH